MTQFIAVDGIPGSGKTTLLGAMKQWLEARGYSAVIVTEPVDEWIDTGALAALYTDFNRNAYFFQTLAFVTQVNQIERAYNECQGQVDFMLFDRTPFSSQIFTMGLFDNFLPHEKKAYVKWIDRWQIMIPYEIVRDMHIAYIRPSINITLDRIRDRGRSSEISITEEYQSRLERAHDCALLGMPTSEFEYVAKSPFGNVTVIDSTVADEDFRSPESDAINRIMQQLCIAPSKAEIHIK